MKLANNCLRFCHVAVLLAASGSAALADDMEPAAQSSHFTVSGEADDGDGRQLYATIGFALGRRGWMDLSAGNSQASAGIDEIDTTIAAIAAGLDTERVAFAARYTHREDSPSFREHDIEGSLTFLFPRSAVSIDAFLRSAESETITSIELRRLNPLAVRITESLDGYGLGLRLEMEPVESLSLIASFMKYDYQRTTNRPLLLQRLALQGISVATRDQAFFDTSAHAGAAYRFGSCSIAGDYYFDRALDIGEEIHTGQLTITVPLGERWTLTPWAGYSSNDVFESTGFAGLSLSVLW